MPLLAVAEPTPEAAGYGLYSAATVVDSEDPHAQSGVTWQPTGCGVADAFAIPCPHTATLTFTEGLPLVEASPFGVNAGIRCKPVGTTLDELRDRAATRLRLTEQRAVERAYFTGDPIPAASPQLTAGAGVTVLSGTLAAPVPLKAPRALGLLEEALGNLTGAVGVIHAPRLLAPLLPTEEARGGQLRTKVGTRVAFGTGYLNRAPDGTVPAAGTAWAYATGPVQVVRGPVINLPNDPRDALNRATNDATVQAVRIVSVGHACGLVAVPIDLTA